MRCEIPWGRDRALLRVVLVAAVAARPHGVRGTPAADVRRYVAMDTTMTHVSTVIRSMPTPPSEARIQASMTIPLSKTRSRASRKLVRSAVRSTGIAHSVSFKKGRRTRRTERGRRRQQKGNRSPPPCRWNRRSAGWDCEELHVGDRDAQVPGDSTAPCRARGRERRRCCWHYALPSGTVALPFCLRILTPSVTGSEGDIEIRCNVGA